MPEIMQQIRSDFGPDAVILNTKEVMHGGFLGFFKKKKLEVVAALDPKPLKPTPVIDPNIKFDNKKTKVRSANEQPILQEIQQLKKLIQSQMKSDLQFSPNYLLVYNHLIEQEVEEELAKQLLEHIEEGDELFIDQIALSLKEHLSNLLADKIAVSDDQKAKVIHFVGPTGVGKTTTLAKIAAEYMLKKNKSIAFITTDTYRIAAIDQLKTYAKILNVPVEVAYSKEDYIKAIEKFSSYDYIYVDTAGRNYREEKFITNLKETINLSSNSKTYLVLTLTAKQKDVLDIFNRFHQLNIDNIIFTKIDETTQYGSIINIALNYKVKIGYLTNGQDVPNDIIQPTGDYISDLILGEFLNE